MVAMNRAAERIVGALGKYKSGANIKVGPIREGGLGARPQEILRLYMLYKSVFWGLLRLLSRMHTVHSYLPVAVFV